MFTKYHVVSAALHFIQTIVSYTLMLAAMTYNTWVILSLCAGFGVGHALFGWYTPTKPNKIDAAKTN